MPGLGALVGGDIRKFRGTRPYAEYRRRVLTGSIEGSDTRAAR
jgi:hypothetical protein